MKPRKRPGKAAGARSSKTKSGTPLSESQMDHLRSHKEWGTSNIRAGRGGDRSRLQLDYEEGRELASKPMPGREPEDISEDGIRRTGKRH